jgi:molybdopterin converting factor small subunit
MPRIQFTQHLRRFFPDLPDSVELEGATAREVVDSLESHFPGMRSYLLDDRGRLRRHVNIFIGDQMVADRTTLKDPVPTDAEVSIMQALSGG